MNGTCPNCGYCPCCGRRNWPAQAVPVYPNYGPRPGPTGSLGPYFVPSNAQITYLNGTPVVGELLQTAGPVGEAIQIPSADGQQFAPVMQADSEADTILEAEPAV